MNDIEFIDYLKTNHPYLYDLEIKVREIQTRTGYGDVSVSYTIRNSKVVSSDVGGFTKTHYIKSVNNQI